MNGGAVAGIVLFSLLLCVAIIAFLLRSKLAWRIATDIPNGRSLHTSPIPRIGGWGLVPAAIAAALVFGNFDWYLAAFAAVLFVISYLDDRVGLPIYVRLPAHAAAAAAWLSFGPVSLPLHIAAMAAFAIVWITNLFNFMDGADGLAGGMALLAFGIFGVVAARAGVTPLALWSFALAGASAGFLIFNLPPARVFLGDAGSVTIGFLAGAFGIWGWAAGAWPAWFPFLVSAPFFLDATGTILRRMARGEKFWRAHREHYYQRLIRSGWSHRRTAVFEYVLMGASAGFAVVMLAWSPLAQYVGLIFAAAVYIAVGFAIDRRWAAFRGTERAARIQPVFSNVEPRVPQRQRPGALPSHSTHARVVSDAQRAVMIGRRIANEEQTDYPHEEAVLTREPDSVVQK